MRKTQHGSSELSVSPMLLSPCQGLDQLPPGLPLPLNWPPHDHPRLLLLIPHKGAIGDPLKTLVREWWSQVLLSRDAEVGGSKV